MFGHQDVSSPAAEIKPDNMALMQECALTTRLPYFSVFIFYGRIIVGQKSIKKPKSISTLNATFTCHQKLPRRGIWNTDFLKLAVKAAAGFKEPFIF